MSASPSDGRAGFDRVIFWGYKNSVRVTYDPRKRARTLAERGLDFEDAGLVFAGPKMTVEDARFDYGEVRYWTYGYLRGRLVNIVWTPRAGNRRIISMRKCNAKEVSIFEAFVDRSR